MVFSFFCLDNSRSILLSLCGFIGGFIVPAIRFCLFGIEMFTKVDSSFLALYMFRSLLRFCEGFVKYTLMYPLQWIQ